MLKPLYAQLSPLHLRAAKPLLKGKDKHYIPSLHKHNLEILCPVFRVNVLSK